MKWVFKLFSKIIISRLPVAYSIWNSLGIFKHGQMDDFQYSLKIFELHISRAFPSGVPKNLTMLELGPGDSIASALFGYGAGAKKVILVDVGSFAKKDVSFYKSLAKKMILKGWRVPDLSDAKCFDDVLKKCNAIYLTNGLSSLNSLHSNTVDFAWSHSVLEHIRKHEIEQTFCELKRILKPKALSSHNIDYQDHFVRGLNNLRFSEAVWESNLFVNSGFYTNRVPAIILHKMFRDAGFKVNKEQFGKFPTLPIKRSSLHKEFHIFTDDDLINCTSHVLLES